MVGITVILSSLVATILLIWFRTEAYLEYCRLFRLNKISKYKEFDEKYKNDVSLAYLGYLRQYHNGFTIRLITCPVCVAVWLTLPLVLIFSNIIMFPVVFIAGLLIFSITNHYLG